MNLRKQDATYSILVAGLGGQGVLHLSKVLACAGRRASGYVCRSEFRGLSQRGGSVQSVVRVGPVPIAPVVDTGGADLLLALDALEAVRCLSFVRASGAVVSNAVAVPPLHIVRGWRDAEQAKLRGKAFQDGLLLALQRHPNGLCLDSAALSLRAGDPRSENIALLGAASVHLPWREEWLKEAILACTLPARRDANLLAFEIGRDAARTAAIPLTTSLAAQSALAASAD